MSEILFKIKKKIATPRELSRLDVFIVNFHQILHIFFGVLIVDFKK